MFSGGIFGGALLASAVTLGHRFGAGALRGRRRDPAGARVLGAARPVLMEEPPAPRPSRARPPAGPVEEADRPAVLWLGLAMVLATITEGAMTDWSALYLKDVTRAADHLAPLGIAVTSGMMVLARLFADGWREPIGATGTWSWPAATLPPRARRRAAAGGAYPALAGFACAGLGMAAVSPCLYMAAAERRRRRWPGRHDGHDRPAGGAAGDRLRRRSPPDLTVAMAVVAACAVLVAVCSRWVTWKERDGGAGAQAGAETVAP